MILLVSPTVTLIDLDFFKNPPKPLSSLVGCARAWEVAGRSHLVGKGIVRQLTCHGTQNKQQHLAAFAEVLIPGGGAVSRRRLAIAGTAFGHEWKFTFKLAMHVVVSVCQMITAYLCETSPLHQYPRAVLPWMSILTDVNCSLLQSDLPNLSFLECGPCSPKPKIQISDLLSHLPVTLLERRAVVEPPESHCLAAGSF